jgi:hypothetical protein
MSACSIAEGTGVNGDMIRKETSFVSKLLGLYGTFGFLRVEHFVEQRECEAYATIFILPCDETKFQTVPITDLATGKRGIL